VSASQYRFPFRDATFDFVFLTSVFTHMLPDDVERYVGEIGRVLAPGGRCFFTAYVISEVARQHLAAGASVRNFQPVGKHWTESTRTPEASLAYPEAYLRELFARCDLDIARIVPGEWWTQVTAQDILVAHKRG
jgi:SAM-dependent methyltransferase